MMFLVDLFGMILSVLKMIRVGPLLLQVYRKVLSSSDQQNLVASHAASKRKGIGPFVGLLINHIDTSKYFQIQRLKTADTNDI